jgi:predicted Ser/Thr protein kinase
VSRDDELATTATAPPSGLAPRAEAERLGETLGRYRIERELGAGGMGVVYAAFDPDLERRVALKVLAPGVAGTAEQRLLREARAMARLTHGNVVAVYEVGSAGGRDFIAMELIDGESLVEWLRAKPRSEAEIVDAFVQAGRGLVAAHAAGVIHRDFKPHNVLRSRDGRVAVTDFGLAREASDPLAVTAPIDARGAPTSLSGLTQAGSMLGTPAYMAPEQWRGERITTATDQFAYCVALWEALAGARPYEGTTVDALRERIFAGPDTLDDTKIPRRLRKVLLRGLAPEPSRRWPSLEALLARIKRAERRPGLAIAIVVGALAIAGSIVFALRDRGAAVVADACPAPVLDPTPTAAQLAELGPSWESAALLRDAAAGWQRERTVACALPAAARATRLGCLDRVAARIDVARRAHVLADSKAEHVRGIIVDPKVCAMADPPRLPLAYSEHAVAALGALGGTIPPDRLLAAREAVADPCVRAYLGMQTASASPRDADDVRNAASLCGDDYAYATAAIISLRTRIAAVLAADAQERLADAERAVARTTARELRYMLFRTKADLAFVNQDTDKALAQLDEAGRFVDDPIKLLELFYDRATLLVNRGRPGDLARVRNEALAGRITALVVPDAAKHVALFDLADATAQWKQGDVEAAHPRLLALLDTAPPPKQKERKLAGIVVDAKGRPVAGATVASGHVVIGDSVGIAVPMIDPVNNLTRQIEIVKTDANGAFTLQYAPTKGAALAQLGTARSKPILVGETPLRLVLGPTTTVTGRVTLHGPRTNELSVGIVGDMAIPYWLSMPVRDDGTFEIAGVTTGTTRIGVWRTAGALTGSTTFQPIKVSAKPLAGLVLDTATRALRVLVRSATNVPVTGGLVFVLSGNVRPKTVAEIAVMKDVRSVALQSPLSVLGEPPKEIASMFRPNDLVATFDGAPHGEASVCAFGFQGELADKAYFARIQAALEKRPEAFALHCTALAAKDEVIVVEVPAMKRLD